MTIAESTGPGMRISASALSGIGEPCHSALTIMATALADDGYLVPKCFMMKQVRKSLHSMSKVHSNGMRGATWLRQPRYR